MNIVISCFDIAFAFKEKTKKDELYFVKNENSKYIQKRTKRYKKVQKGTKRYKEVQRGTTRYKKVQKGTKRYKKVQKGTKRYKEVQRGTKRYKKVQTDRYNLSTTIFEREKSKEKKKHKMYKCPNAEFKDKKKVQCAILRHVRGCNNMSCTICFELKKYLESKQNVRIKSVRPRFVLAIRILESKQNVRIKSIRPRFVLAIRILESRQNVRIKSVRPRFVLAIRISK